MGCMAGVYSGLRRWWERVHYLAPESLIGEIVIVVKRTLHTAVICEFVDVLWTPVIAIDGFSSTNGRRRCSINEGEEVVSRYAIPKIKAQVHTG